MQNIDRRQFLGTIAKPAAVASVVMTSPTLMAKALTGIRSTAGNPKDIARDESFWREIQQGYTADRGLINLNNGGVSPSPTVVQEALKRYLDFSNTSPAYSMWRILEPQKETIRKSWEGSGGPQSSLASVRSREGPRYWPEVVNIGSFCRTCFGCCGGD
jgi:hypothetical protein